MKFPRIFHAPLVNVHHAAFWLATFSIFSAILGMLRDRMLAGIFGASRSLDMYYAAFRVPDFIYTLILFFAASTAIIPIFLESWEDNRVRGERLFGGLLVFFGALIACSALLAYVAMPRLTRILLPGFLTEEQMMVTTLSRIMLFSPFFLGLSNIFSGITQSFRRFFVYAISPVLYNLGIIAGILFFLPRFGLSGLAWGVALGTLLHMSIQIPSMVNLGVRPRFFKSLDGDVAKVIALSLPRTLGLTTTQITQLIFTGAASTLAAGSISVFTLASNLEYIPVTLIGLSYSVAAFPNLADLIRMGAREEFQKNFSVALRHIVFWSLPFAILLLILRAQVVRVVLGSGSFNWTDTRLTAASLLLLSLAILFQNILMLLVRALYAGRETLRPVVINVISSVVSIGSVFWFIRLLSYQSWILVFLHYALRLEDIADIRVLALPLALFLGSAINAIFLFFAFWIVFGWAPTKGSEIALSKIIAGSIAGGGAAYGALQVFARAFNLEHFFGIFLQGFLAGICGIVVAVLTLWILKSEELSEIYAGAKGLIWRDHVPTPEPEKLL